MFLNSRLVPVFCLNTPTPDTPTLEAVLASPPPPLAVTSTVRTFPVLEAVIAAPVKFTVFTVPAAPKLLPSS